MISIIDQNNRDYDFGHNRTALITSTEDGRMTASSVLRQKKNKQHWHTWTGSPLISWFQMTPTWCPPQEHALVGPFLSLMWSWSFLLKLERQWRVYLIGCLSKSDLCGWQQMTCGVVGWEILPFNRRTKASSSVCPAHGLRYRFGEGLFVLLRQRWFPQMITFLCSVSFKL